MSEKNSYIIACPTCKAPSTLDSKNLYRPFCCKRCKLIELGLWMDEVYSIPEHSNQWDSAEINSETATTNH